MKQVRILSVLLGLQLLTLNSQAQERELKDLLYTRQYPKLEAVLSSSRVSSSARILYQAFLRNAYNQPWISDRLLHKSRYRMMDDSLRFWAHRTAYDNTVKQNNYRAAYRASEVLLKKFPAFFDSAQWEDQQEESRIWKALARIPPQRVLADKTVSLPVQRDLAGLWNIPVRTGDSTYSFVFDTGAGISSITETYSAKLGLKLVKGERVTIRSGLTGKGTGVQLGVARQLQLGALRIENAVFLVFPDSALSFAGGAYKINGIIGLPIIKGFGEVTISRDSMTIPLNKNRSPVTRNLILDLLNPVIYLNFRGEALPFTFDCGAQASLFSDNFYQRFKDILFTGAQYDTTGIGGAGGERTLKVVELPILHFTLGQSAFRVLKAQVSLEPLPAQNRYYYGNIGQDVTNQFQTVTLNFINASISLLNREP